MFMMSGSMPAPWFFLVILSIHMPSLELTYCMIENYNNDDILCPKLEKEALLSFKQSLADPSDKLSSWNNGSLEANCCKWKGVVCDNFTGHVYQLHLRKYGFQSISLNSLRNLTRLRYLDLSKNHFDGAIPPTIGSLTSLEHLDLSSAGFGGAIPHSTGNLSNLCSLALEQHDTSILYANRLEWLSGLSKLKHLNMNGVNLSKAAANWATVINSLPSLVELRFADCNLNFITANMMNEVNLSSSLAVLDLSGYLDYFLPYSSNNVGIFPCVPRWIFQLSNLTFLDLSGNYFEGPIPSISNTTKLQYIVLSYNYFNSTIPDWLYSCRDLHFVDLKYNLLRGTISSAIANLSSLNTLDLTRNEFFGKIPGEIANLCKMQTLELTSNKLQGELSDSLGNMSDCFLDSLQVFSLDDNLLSGAIPLNLGQLMSLQVLDLSQNKLSGNLPESLGNLFNLKYLSIGGNELEGVVTESHFANLTKLGILDASYNHRLTLKVNPNWIPPFQLAYLQLASWDLGSKNIPSWIKKQKNLYYLDLSSTGILGVLPNWIWGISCLNLSHNHLHGKIPDKFDSIIAYLSSNQFSGPLPRVRDTVIGLDLSDNSFSGGLSHFLCDDIPNLEFLHLGGNQLTGELPDCFMKCRQLKMLDLGNNNLSGSIPNSIGFLVDLVSLDLQNNKFSGQIPFSMQNCTKLVKIDLNENSLDGNVPTWIGKRLSKLVILILRSNKLSGEISSDICLLNSLQILDLSNNNISGTIPGCVNNFTAMVEKHDLSPLNELLIPLTFIERATVFTKGNKYQYDTILSLVTNMDLSTNNLTGVMPLGLTDLLELRSLNLSGNQLTGLIRNNIGDMKQLESLDLSRNFLSGGIPNSFTAMASLNYLNLSHNKLTGRIPESTQFNTFNALSFIGNQLCGPPLTRNCSSNGDQVPAPTDKEGHEGGESKIDWFYVFLSSGFATGFLVVCSTFILNKSWRDAYFGFVEDVWDKLYVFFYVKWRMLARG